MTNVSKAFKYIKALCFITLSVFALLIIAYVSCILLQTVNSSTLNHLGELCATLASYLIYVCYYLSHISFSVTSISCAVICLHEHTIKYFLKPFVIVNLLITLIYHFVISHGF